MGKKKKAAYYRPDFSSQYQDSNDVMVDGPHDHINERNDQQGDYEAEDASYRINIYAAVDSWRSYSNGIGSITVTAPTQGLNSAASTSGTGNYARTEFTPYQPLRSVQNYTRYPTYRVDKSYRFSYRVNERQDVHGLTQSQLNFSGTNEKLVWQGFSQSQPSLHTQKYVLRPKKMTRDFSSDHPIQSVEDIDSPDTDFGQHHSDQDMSLHTVSPPPAPDATKAYLDQAQLPTVLRNTPQPLLVILDLNGTLIVKPNKGNRRKFITRPGVEQLFEYLFKHHVVMIYTSSTPFNADNVVNKLFSWSRRKQLAAIWARDKLDLTAAQYAEKVQVYKKLDKIWHDESIQAKCPAGARWDQTNTILVDDSNLKALAQPHNLIQVPEFTAFSHHNASKAAIKLYKSQQEEILKSLVAKLEELKWQTDVSRLIMRWQIDKAKIPKVPGSELLFNENMDQKELAQLLTPESSDSDSDSDSDGGVALTGENRVVGLGTNLDAYDDDDLSVDDKLDVYTEYGEVGTGLPGKLSESPIPESVWADLLGENKDAGPKDSSR
jgi:NLI interacting factor-like phosphatase